LAGIEAEGWWMLPANSHQLLEAEGYQDDEK